MNPLLLNRFQLRAPFLSPDGDDGGGGGSSDSNANAGGNQGGSEGKQGDGKGEGGQEGAKPEAVTVVIEGKTYLLQDHANKLIGDARKEGKTAGANEAKRLADEEAAKKRGDFEKLANDRQAEIDRLTAELAKRDQDALRARVAAKHKLPADLADRLRGETEAELEADAKGLAKLVKPPVAPDTEAGGAQANGNGGLSHRQKDAKPTTETPNYRFVPKGAIPIPS